MQEQSGLLSIEKNIEKWGHFGHGITTILCVGLVPEIYVYSHAIENFNKITLETCFSNML